MNLDDFGQPGSRDKHQVLKYLREFLFLHITNLDLIVCITKYSNDICIVFGHISDKNVYVYDTLMFSPLNQLALPQNSNLKVVVGGILNAR